MGKYALLVGIDTLNSKYQGTKYLNGCKNDVFKFNDALVYGGFNKKNIQILLDNDAYQSRILSELESLIKKSSMYDYIIFYFAGYGSTRINTSFSTSSNSPLNKLEEILCPYDYNSNNLVISLENILEIIKRNNISHEFKFQIVLDCSFYSISNFLNYIYEDTPFLKNKKIKNRFIYNENYSISPNKKINELNLFDSRSTSFGNLRKTFSNIKLGVWRSSQSFEQTYELEFPNESVHGLFSYSLCRNMLKTDVKNNQRYRLLANTNNEMSLIYREFELNLYVPPQQSSLDSTSEDIWYGNMWNGPIDP